LIRSNELTLDEKLNMVKTYGKNTKEWIVPRN